MGIVEAEAEAEQVEIVIRAPDPVLDHGRSRIRHRRRWPEAPTSAEGIRSLNESTADPTVLTSCTRSIFELPSSALPKVLCVQGRHICLGLVVYSRASER